jgi:hypothetical protein
MKESLKKDFSVQKLNQIVQFLLETLGSKTDFMERAPFSEKLLSELEKIGI